MLSLIHLFIVAWGSASRPNPAGEGGGLFASLHVPSHWPDQLEILELCRRMGPGEAALLILAGVVYLLWGINFYRTLVMINATVVGLLLGAVVGERLGSTVAGSLVGGFTAAAVTWPLMKYAIAMMGGIFGALTGASIWRACGQPPDFAWAGALTGCVLFGLMAFILFKNCIIFYLSLQGSVMLLLGLMGLLCKYQAFQPRVANIVTTQPLATPTAIFIPLVIGLIFQHAGAKKLKPPSAPGGAPPGGGGGPPKK